MENQERLKQAGVLDPYNQLTPELSDAIESLTADEVEDLISGRSKLRAADADDEQRPIIAPPPDKDKDKDKGKDDVQRPIIAPPPDDDDEDDEDDDKDDEQRPIIAPPPHRDKN